MFAITFLSFFSDESALANFFICGVLFWRQIFLFAPAWYRYLYLLLPVMFLLVTKFALPLVYAVYSVHGPWDALSDGKKLTIFQYLFSASFYDAAATQLARSMLSSLGISVHVPLTQAIILFIFVAALLYSALRTFSTKDGRSHSRESPPLFCCSTGNEHLPDVVGLVSISLRG